MKKILVFMSTTSRNLIDLARAAQVKLRAALTLALEDDRGSGGSCYYDSGQREVDVSALVHGYQIDGTNELGTMEFDFTINRGDPAGDRATVSWVWPDNSAPTYIPGDTTVVSTWIEKKLVGTKGEPPDRRPLDSTMLVFWGHGLGAGTNLTLPRQLPGGLVDTVRGPGLANIGGFHEKALVKSLNQSLAGWNGSEGRQDRKIDILVLDSCLMASAELACEFGGLARYMVASQTLVDTAPGGPPGLNTGALIGAFLRDGAWCGNVSDVNERSRRLRDAASSIADLVGEAQSGAQQLTVFSLERRTEKVDAQISEARTWFEAKAEDGVAKDMENLQSRLRPSDPKAAARVDIVGLFWLFTRLLVAASEDLTERERIKLAFRNAAYWRARQFLDLRDLAFQVHQVSQHSRLQIAALALFNELTPRRDGFIVAHRAALRIEDKLRVGGVSVYCPWFKIHPGEAEGVFNVTIERARYGALTLPDTTDWDEFAFGPLFEATSVEREPPTPDMDPSDCCWLLLSQLIREHGDCGCGLGGALGALGGLGGKPSGGPLGGKPSGGPLGGKPSGGPLGGKPSGGPLGGKPSGDTLGGKPSGDTLGGKPSGDTLGPSFQEE